MLSSFRLDGLSTGAEAGPYVDPAQRRSAWGTFSEAAAEPVHALLSSTLRWPSGQPLNPINLSKFKRDERIASSSRLDDLPEAAGLLLKPEPIPAPLRPLADWIDRFSFVNPVSLVLILALDECLGWDCLLITRLSLQNLGSASQLGASLSSLATRLDPAQVEPALIQLLTRLSALLGIPFSANAPDDDDLGQSYARPLSQPKFATRSS